MVDRRSVSPAAKRMLHVASRTTGRISHRARMLPGFLIVGAQRCGTTSMYRALSQHPAVRKAVLHKGVHYFDTGYANGPAWYRGHFPLLWTARRVECGLGVRPITGESSPYYMFHPLAGERIGRDLPDAKLIVLVRDPVERAYSAHSHELARGFETEPSFERALELEPRRLAGEVERMLADPSYQSHAHQHNAYVLRGQYVEQLERLAGQVGRQRLLVVDSHIFFGDPESAWERVLAFLCLPRLGSPTFERHNARWRAPMADSLRRRLEDHFGPSDERLTAWLGTVPSWRR